MRLDEATVFRALIGGILLMLVIAIVLWFATARETGTVRRSRPVQDQQTMVARGPTIWRPISTAWFFSA